MNEAKVAFGDLDAIAVTYGPGLAGSLLVGVNAAKAIAFANGLPLVGVNHLEGHLYANWLESAGATTSGVPADGTFPLIALIVSGGHSEIVLMREHGDYELLGHTLDDAAGEAFDKVARLLGLSYPGGPAIQKSGRAGRSERVQIAARVAARDVRFFVQRAEDGGATPRPELRWQKAIASRGHRREFSDGGRRCAGGQDAAGGGRISREANRAGGRRIGKRAVAEDDACAFAGSGFDSADQIVR